MLQERLLGHRTIETTRKSQPQDGNKDVKIIKVTMEKLGCGNGLGGFESFWFGCEILLNGM